MEIKSTATLIGVKPVMRPVLREAERIWIDLGRPEGVTVTSGTDSLHSAESWHYYGYAVDFRIDYKNKGLGQDIPGMEAATRLREALGSRYDVVLKHSHIHVEISNMTAKLLGVYF